RGRLDGGAGRSARRRTMSGRNAPPARGRRRWNVVGGGGAAMLIGLRESEAPALVAVDGTSLSYRALAAQVREEAALLRAHGAGPGRVVALASSDARRFVVSALAAWECEAV